MIIAKMTLPIETIDKLILTNLFLMLISLGLVVFNVFAVYEVKSIFEDKMEYFHDLLGAWLKKDEQALSDISSRLTISSGELESAAAACRAMIKSLDKVESNKEEQKRSAAQRFFYGDSNQGK